MSTSVGVTLTTPPGTGYRCTCPRQPRKLISRAVCWVPVIPRSLGRSETGPTRYTCSQPQEAWSEWRLHTSPRRVEIWYGFILQRSCACCHIHEFVCVATLLCPEDIVSSYSSTASGYLPFYPLLQLSLDFKRRGCEIHFPFRAYHSAVFYFLHLGWLWVSVFTTTVYCK